MHVRDHAWRTASRSRSRAIHRGARRYRGRELDPHAATLGGHVSVGDWAVVSAGSAVHQFCRIGRHCIVGGFSVITQDVLPFSTTVTEREARIFGANKTGLERRGYSAESIDALHKAFRLLTRAGLNTSQAVERITEEVDTAHGLPAEISELLQFMAESTRGFVK